VPNLRNIYEKLRGPFSGVKKFWLLLAGVLAAIVLLVSSFEAASKLYNGVKGYFFPQSNGIAWGPIPEEWVNNENNAAARIALSVKPLRPINPNDTFTTPFEISNNEQFAIYDVEYTCVLAEAETASKDLKVKHVTLGPGPEIAVLAPHDKATGLCGGVVPGMTADEPLARADMAFSVSFARARQSSQRMTKYFYFRGVLEPDGEVRWLSYPG
jgi:hypothetical protein